MQVALIQPALQSRGIEVGPGKTELISNGKRGNGTCVVHRGLPTELVWNGRTSRAARRPERIAPSMSPKNSVLNKHNQVWDAPNVFVTDGSCMASTACQNPSLTYMALTARAADFAVSELNKRNL